MATPRGMMKMDLLPSLILPPEHFTRVLPPLITFERVQVKMISFRGYVMIPRMNNPSLWSVRPRGTISELNKRIVLSLGNSQLDCSNHFFERSTSHPYPMYGRINGQLSHLNHHLLRPQWPCVGLCRRWRCCLRYGNDQG
jgi:hypothetical protein